MPGPHFDKLTATSARAYADWLANLFGTVIVDFSHVDEDGIHVFTMADGSDACVWFESGRVYGEA